MVLSRILSYFALPISQQFGLCFGGLRLLSFVWNKLYDAWRHRREQKLRKCSIFTLLSIFALLSM